MLGIEKIYGNNRSVRKISFEKEYSIRGYKNLNDTSNSFAQFLIDPNNLGKSINIEGNSFTVLRQRGNKTLNYAESGYDQMIIYCAVDSGKELNYSDGKDVIDAMERLLKNNYLNDFEYSKEVQGLYFTPSDIYTIPEILSSDYPTSMYFTNSNRYLLFPYRNEYSFFIGKKYANSWGKIIECKSTEILRLIYRMVIYFRIMG